MKSRKGTATDPIRTLAVINIVDIAVIRQLKRYRSCLEKWRQLTTSEFCRLNNNFEIVSLHHDFRTKKIRRNS